MVDLEAVYDEREEQARLAAVLDGRYAAMLAAVHELVLAAFPDRLDPFTFRLDDAATRRVLEQAAERVVLIDATTRQALREALQEGQRLGLSAWEIAHGAPAQGFAGIDALFQVTWAGRAETVARTELQHAQVVSTLDRYGATGLVDRVRIHEHTDTDEPCAARNGRVVPLAERPGLLHPNCRVGLTPVLADEEAA